MTVANISPVAKYAFSWVDLQSERGHLESHFQNDNLNDEQADYLSDHIKYISEQIEELEFYLFEQDETGKFYNDVRNAADMLTVTPSEEFLNRVKSNLSEMI